MRETILVAGGTGFLGYHFIKKALKKGFKVISISQNNPSKKRFLKKVNHIQFLELVEEDFNFFFLFNIKKCILVVTQAN